MKKHLITGIAAFAASFLLCAVASGSANAEFIVNIDQVGPNVVVTGSGSLDLSGLIMEDGSQNGIGYLNPVEGYVSFGPPNLFVTADVALGASIGCLPTPHRY